MSNKPGRFDYVKYDEKAVSDQSHFKNAFEIIEHHVDSMLRSPRAKAVAHTKLEEAYMWIGKAIRDDQIERNGSEELQNQRGSKEDK